MHFLATSHKIFAAPVPNWNCDGLDLSEEFTSWPFFFFEWQDSELIDSALFEETFGLADKPSLLRTSSLLVGVAPSLPLGLCLYVRGTVDQCWKEKGHYHMWNQNSIRSQIWLDHKSGTMLRKGRIKERANGPCMLACCLFIVNWGKSMNPG